jgi:hypothetical protein
LIGNSFRIGFSLNRHKAERGTIVNGRFILATALLFSNRVYCKMSLCARLWHIHAPYIALKVKALRPENEQDLKFCRRRNTKKCDILKYTPSNTARKPSCHTSRTLVLFHLLNVRKFAFLLFSKLALMTCLKFSYLNT